MSQTEMPITVISIEPAHSRVLWSPLQAKRPVSRAMTRSCRNRISVLFPRKHSAVWVGVTMEAVRPGLAVHGDARAVAAAIAKFII